MFGYLHLISKLQATDWQLISLLFFVSGVDYYIIIIIIMLYVFLMLVVLY